MSVPAIRVLGSLVCVVLAGCGARGALSVDPPSAAEPTVDAGTDPGPEPGPGPSHAAAVEPHRLQLQKPGSNYKLNCPGCSGDLVQQEGCEKCLGCGWSQC